MKIKHNKNYDMLCPKCNEIIDEDDDERGVTTHAGRTVRTEYECQKCNAYFVVERNGDVDIL